MGNKTSMNLDENVAGLLCYLGVWVTGLIFYILEKENKTVRFHAMQSIITFLPLSILIFLFSWILWFIPFIGWVITALIGLLIFILWIVLMLKAYQGEKFKLPIVGDIAEKNS